MDWDSLKLKVISCKDLKAFNFFQKISVYSVVTVVNEAAKKKDDQQKHLQQRKKTSVDKGGKNPEWNREFVFDLKILPWEESDSLFLKFDLRCEGLVNRSIGEVKVPLKDLIDEFCGIVRFVSYQVRNSDGKPNGVLNFSYKLLGGTQKTGNCSPRVDSPSPSENQIPSEKVVYPKVEFDSPSRELIRYPSLDDAYTPRKISFPSPVFEYQSSAPATATAYYSWNSVLVPVPVQVMLPVSGNGTYLHPYSTSSPLAQPTGSGKYLYTVDSTSCNNHQQNRGSIKFDGFV